MKMLSCNYCGKTIDPKFDSYYTCLDNFIQNAYFDEEEENIFCCKEHFCNYIQLEEIYPEDEEE